MTSGSTRKASALSSIPKSTLNDTARSLSLSRKKRKRCPRRTANHMHHRLLFCIKHLHDNFKHWAWTDEKIFTVTEDQYQYVFHNQQTTPLQMDQHDAKVCNIWIKYKKNINISRYVYILYLYVDMYVGYGMDGVVVLFHRVLCFRSTYSSRSKKEEKRKRIYKGNASTRDRNSRYIKIHTYIHTHTYVKNILFFIYVYMYSCVPKNHR